MALRRPIEHYFLKNSGIRPKGRISKYHLVSGAVPFHREQAAPQAQIAQNVTKKRQFYPQFI